MTYVVPLKTDMANSIRCIGDFFRRFFNLYKDGMRGSVCRRDARDPAVGSVDKVGSSFFYAFSRFIIALFIFLAFFSLTKPQPAYSQEASGRESVKGNLKIVFIIDTSDSMNKGERFIRVKKAMTSFVNSLIEGDYFIVVTFDTKAYLKYSGLAGDDRVRKAILRVFDDNYPDNEPVKGMASQIMMGVDKAFNEIVETPPYQSTAIVLFTDGDHNPIPTEEEWKNLCGKIIQWKKEPGFEGTRKVFAVDVGDPKHSKIMADDLEVEGEDYFPYSEETDFGKILEKIRSRLPYHFVVKFFPSKMNLGKFHEPGEIAGNPVFILNNADFIKKGGYIVPEITFYKDGNKLDNPGISANIPDRIDKEFFTDNFILKFDRKPAPGKYSMKISFKPEGPLNTKLDLQNEEGKTIENAEIDFEVTSWAQNNKPLMIFGVIFLLTLAGLYFGLGMTARNMPEVRGELQCHPQGVDMAPSAKKLRVPVKVLIYTHGKNAVTVGRGKNADIQFDNIDFLENEHFEIAADTNYNYRVKPMEGRITVLDDRDNDRGARTLKNGYKIRVENPDNPDKEYVLFEIKNRDLR